MFQFYKLILSTESIHVIPIIFSINTYSYSKYNSIKITPFVSPNTNIKGVFPTWFGISVPNSGKTKHQFKSYFPLGRYCL